MQGAQASSSSSTGSCRGLGGAGGGGGGDHGASVAPESLGEDGLFDAVLKEAMLQHFLKLAEPQKIYFSLFLDLRCNCF